MNQLIETLEKQCKGGALVVQLWCDSELPDDDAAVALMRDQATELRLLADVLDELADEKSAPLAPPETEGAK